MIDETSKDKGIIKMPIHIFTIPFDPYNEIFDDEVLAKFLLNKRATSLRPPGDTRIRQEKG